MTTALIASEQKFPDGRRQKPLVPTVIPNHMGIRPVTLPAMHLEADQSGWFSVERRGGTYGPDGRMVYIVSTGLMVDIHV
jgi:hypothetical protein